MPDRIGQPVREASSSEVNGTEALAMSWKVTSGVLLVGALACARASFAGARFQPQWTKDLFPIPGANSDVRAIAAFDDGNGPAVYVGGWLTAAGLAHTGGLARWDGEAWSRVGDYFDGWVYALAVYDDGSGPALYVGGYFTTAGGQTAHNLARWDGTAWSGVRGGTDYIVLSLTAFDDGNGPALFVGGLFTSAGGKPVKHIARWDGESWSALGAGTNGPVRALAEFDDGSGPALYVGGDFARAGDAKANNIARWDGQTWSALANGTSGGMTALTVLDDGSGPALYAGGWFTHADGVEVNSIAKWDGHTWSALGEGMDDPVQALAVFDDGTGAALYAGGCFHEAGGTQARRLARWDGTDWSAVGGSLPHSSVVYALAVGDDGSGPGLYAGGLFTLAGQTGVKNVACWDGHTWSALGPGINRLVSAIEHFDDDTGPALYVGGRFEQAGDVPTKNIARWDGQIWAPLGAGLDNEDAWARVSAMTVFDDGQGPALYAGGSFDFAGHVELHNIARWDGADWSTVGTGFCNPDIPHDAAVGALCVFDDGGSPRLYAGGAFTHAGDIPVNHIAQWNGEEWLPLGQGLRTDHGGCYVWAAAIFDDGSGPALFVAGSFDFAGELPANNIAKWDGNCWSPLGSGADYDVHALAVFDDGNGPALYAAGWFRHMGGLEANGVAKWDGEHWSPIGPDPDDPFAYRELEALAVFDDGGGPALYAGGLFTINGEFPPANLGKWDGASWSPAGGGTNHCVNALHVVDDPAGPFLYVGGAFTVVGDIVSGGMARWGPPLSTQPADRAPQPAPEPVPRP